MNTDAAFPSGGEIWNVGCLNSFVNEARLDANAPDEQQKQHDRQHQ
ncbi:MAG: hypothetical protein MSG64_17840 [Pyrinomonadaceae bacterium MAG19_C2-C3]|nr:hypothetical protein [Pyrinomonadaceae bacterium MAG19_C2-C3]